MCIQLMHIKLIKVIFLSKLQMIPVTIKLQFKRLKLTKFHVNKYKRKLNLHIFKLLLNSELDAVSITGWV